MKLETRKTKTMLLPLTAALLALFAVAAQAASTPDETVKKDPSDHCVIAVGNCRPPTKR